MSKIMDAFATKTALLHGAGGTPEQILQAEQELGVPFSEEYHEYLSLYGIAAYDGHELTGLSKSQRLNVVFSTLEARKKYPSLPAGLYVVEETGIEELIVLQNSTGEIYGCAPNYELEKVFDSLSEYILNS